MPCLFPVYSRILQAGGLCPSSRKLASFVVGGIATLEVWSDPQWWRMSKRDM